MKAKFKGGEVLDFVSLIDISVCEKWPSMSLFFGYEMLELTCRSQNLFYPLSELPQHNLFLDYV